MQSFFKTAKINVDGVELTIRELAGAAHLELQGKAHIEIAEQVCRLCVIEWKDETAETIRANVPARVMRDIVDKVFALSGLAEPKNSEPTPDAGSSTA